MTEVMLKMTGVFSEIKRNMISQRVKSDMENAKAKGKKIGRPSVAAEDISSVFYNHYPKYNQGGITKKTFHAFAGFPIRLYINILVLQRAKTDECYNHIP